MSWSAISYTLLRIISKTLKSSFIEFDLRLKGSHTTYKLTAVDWIIRFAICRIKLLQNSSRCLWSNQRNVSSEEPIKYCVLLLVNLPLCAALSFYDEALVITRVVKVECLVLTVCKHINHLNMLYSASFSISTRNTLNCVSSWDNLQNTCFQIWRIHSMTKKHVFSKACKKYM